MRDIPQFETFVAVHPVNRGCSGDSKYCIETAGGERLLLRISGIEENDRRKAEYEMAGRVAALGLPASKPVAFGVCDAGRSVYRLYSWCEGVDAAEWLPTAEEAEEYAIGLGAAETLRGMHALPAPEDAVEWGVRFRNKLRGRIEAYRESRIDSPSGERIIEYLLANQQLPDGRPQTFNHGDYNIGNLIVAPGFSVAAIDFNHYNLGYGDPWWEFASIAWDQDVFPHFRSALINGYFRGAPPPEFFPAFCYYAAYDALAALCDAAEMDEVYRVHSENYAVTLIGWFDDFRTPVPSWYVEPLCIQYLDGLPFRLKAPFDFTFVGRYGRVFKIFDDQDSGNLCFGVQDGESRRFVKFAGAPTARAVCSRQDAVANLEAAVPIYRNLAHTNLVRLIADEHVGGGCAAIFDWTDGVCMGKQYPKSRERFMRMPDETKLRVFADILAFHAHVAERGYVAIDFYDGSILYDFTSRKTVVCDIDFYARQPYTNEMGRLWGSSRFMSPEEFTRGARIDEVSNVYCMGATAFVLFSDADRARGAWPLSNGLYAVAKRATSDARELRQQSIDQFIAEWSAAQ